MFQMMFSQPEYIYLLISAVCVLCTLLEFAMLSKYRHWQQVLSCAGLLATNYFSLYNAWRDTLILYQVYKDENIHYD